MTLAPWEHGFASLGGKLVVNKRIVAPQVAAPTPNPAPSPALLGAGDESERVSSSGESRRTSDVEEPEMPAEAGTTEMPMIHSRSETSNSSMSLPSTGSSSELVPDEAMASRTRTAEQAACDVATGLSENPRSPKALKVRHEVNRLEFACVCQINDNKYEHEDEAMEWTLSPEELDDLEEYDHLIEAERREEIDWENVEAQLVFPRDTEHAALDRLADEYELKRLTDMKVLLPPDSKEGPLVGRENPKQLSTKMVRTWREKTMPDPVTKVMRFTFALHVLAGPGWRLGAGIDGCVRRTPHG